MERRARWLVPALLVAGVAVAGLVLSGAGVPIGRPGTSTGPSGGTASDGGLGGPTIAPTPTPPPPDGGRELYGYVPYWQMTGSMANYLETVPLSTVALFSVTASRTGAIDTRPQGYRRITGPIGRRMIDEAHARDARVDLVFTSFGTERNAAFFRPAAAPEPASGPPVPGASQGPGSPGPTLGPAAVPSPAPAPWRRTVGELVGLAAELGVDGINVDVELLDEVDREAYTEFLATLRGELLARLPGATLSVATEAGLRGSGNALAAFQAGVDRLFLMGYDYHWSGSQPGASSPVDRTDGLYDLQWSIAAYVEAGVPRDRILLGLPLYGMTWRTLGPDRTSPVVGAGQPWIPSRHLDRLGDPAFRPGRDTLEHAEFFVEPDGDEWLLTYYDSPATIRTKLALARDQGLAGGGFWAIGYERGVPGFVDVMTDFREGRVDRSEAPATPE